MYFVQLLCVTLALETLSEETPQQTATVVTERRRRVVVDLEAVRDVDVEALRQLL